MKKFNIISILMCSVFMLLYSPVIALQNTLSLEECKQLVLENNKTFAAAQEDADAAKCNKKSAFTNFLPQVKALGNYTHLHQKVEYDLNDTFVDLLNGMQDFSTFAGLGLENDVFYQTLSAMYANGLLDESLALQLLPEDNYAISVVLSQPVFTGGKIIEQYRISNSQEKISQAQQTLTRQEVLQRTEELYWQTVSLKEKVELARQYKTTVNAHWQDLKNLAAEGIITKSDLLKVEVMYNKAELQLQRAQNGLTLVNLALKQVIGLPLNEELIIADDSIEIDLFLEDSSEIGDRPELLMLQQGIEISKSLKRVNLARYCPNIMLNAGYNWINPNPYENFTEEFGEDWSVGVSFEMDIFGWNKRGFDYGTSKHLQRAAEKRYQETEEMIDLEIEQCKFKVAEGRIRISMCEKNYAKADENLGETTNRHHEGLVSSSDILDAQVLWQEAYSSLINAKSEFKIEQVTLKKAMGIL